MYLYDYVLTFTDEVDQLWMSGRSGTAALFCTLRYPPLVNVVLQILLLLPWPSWQTSHSCASAGVAQLTLYVLVLTSAAVFSALRVYAIAAKNLYLGLLTLLLGLVNPGINIYTFTTFTFEPAPFPHAGCIYYVNSNTGFIHWMMGARAASLVNDIVVLIITLMHLTKTNTSGFSAGSDLGRVLTMDTIMYFSLLLIVNLIAIITGRSIDFIAPVTTWIAVLTSILLSRLLLDMREVSTGPAGESTTLSSMILGTFSGGWKAAGDAVEECFELEDRGTDTQVV